MRVTIDGSRIYDIPSFYDEINRAFMRPESWTIANSLDAFNDLLYGGFGILSGDQPVELVWGNIEESRRYLGFDVTKAWYENKLIPGAPYNQTMFTKKLAELEAGTGQTYFDIVLEIIAEHPNITLIPA